MKRGLENEEDDEADDGDYVYFEQEDHEEPRDNFFNFFDPVEEEQQQQAATAHPVPFQALKIRDIHGVRTEHLVVDIVSKYKIISLWTLLFAKQTEGVKVPAVLDSQRASLVPSAKSVKFEF
jgi:hypothetical protein